ncbi:hypothetical protein Sango_0377100 [Sesamum angolense]|uniref:CCHC-type domain-containing protein n=1 Tax=Sesamum angolense TaxID=2727404 RepID=A0AAE2C3R4_9LAMI|nr:hypothetical protein Sango_0377100 [Sesamum angolense]
MKRPARHLDLPPPLYRSEGVDVGEGLEGATGGEHNAEVGEGVEGAAEGDGADVGEEAAEDAIHDSGEGDDLVDSDFDEEIGIVKDTNVEEINEQGGNVRLEDGVVRESTESGGSSDDEEEDVVDNDRDLDEYRDSDEEIRKTNPGSTVIVGTEQVDGEERFSRFYVCFGALKAGFKAGCRPIIGVDGCHLKGPNGGILLTAIGVDPNNNLFPIAYAVVNKECRETWEWFLIVLKHDLNIIREHEYTFMSDKQKGLMQAFEEVFPGCDHRFCVRHLHNNFKQAGFRGLAFKNALWNAAKSCTVGEWKMRMQEMKNLSQQAYDWFNDKPAVQWSRSHFSEASSCDMLLNNVCETFNACILDAREKPILTMLEWIREYLMRRMQENRDKSCTKWKDKLCPKIQQILQKHANKVSDCMPIKADDFHYQISCFDGSQHCVDLGSKSCSCRKWQLSGIPWRPAKARRRESDEPTLKNKQKSKRKQVQKIKRHQTTVHCRTCGEPGHNTAKCPERVPLATQEMTEATINMEGTSVRAGKRKAPTNAVNRIERDRDTATGTQGANIFPPLQPVEDPILEPCITQVESQAAEVPVYNLGHQCINSCNNQTST